MAPGYAWVLIFLIAATVTQLLHHLWSIDITGDVRALYETIGNDAIIDQLIGTH